MFEGVIFERERIIVNILVVRLGEFVFGWF